MRDKISSDHFDAIAERYSRSVVTLKPLYEAVGNELTAWFIGKSILDVGNGGIFAYDRTKASAVTVLDISPEMLERVPPQGVIKIVGDAREMRGCPDESYDVVLFHLSLHHVVDDNLKGTIQGVRNALAASYRKLKPGGHLVLFEPLLNPAFHFAEKLLFWFTQGLLKMFRVPMVFFHSLESLKTLLSEAFKTDLGRITVIVPPVSGWVDPLGGTFPGLVRLPVKLFPTRFHLLRVQKPLG